MSLCIVSRGLAIGPALILGKTKVSPKPICGSVFSEKKSFIQARQKAVFELQNLYQKALGKLSPNQAQIFVAHQELVKDHELEQEIFAWIEQGYSAFGAVQKTLGNHMNTLGGLGDYMSQRKVDFDEVRQRLLLALDEKNTLKKQTLSQAFIVVAEQLTASDIMQLDLDRVAGFLVAHAGIDSHPAILARALELPALSGAAKIIPHIHQGDPLILDALSLSLMIKPSNCQLHKAKIALTKFKSHQRQKISSFKPSAEIFNDLGIALYASISNPEEALKAKAYGALGIGLYRTEFLFIKRSNWPSEQEQFSSYKKVLQTMEDAPVIIRTLDIGGDKAPSYLVLPKESNPNLGLRAVRLCLEYPEILNTQLRALLRAGYYGDFRVLFPMICSLAEIRALKSQLLEQAAYLQAKSIPWVGPKEIGIMIETPAAVMIADQLIDEVDFFSIGSNDLTQYLLAVDRNNASLSALYDPLCPAVLRAINKTQQEVKKAGKWLSVCGELAGDPIGALVLYGLGIDQLSLGAKDIGLLQKSLANTSCKDLKIRAKLALEQETSAQVRALYKDEFNLNQGLTP